MIHFEAYDGAPASYSQGQMEEGTLAQLREITLPNSSVLVESARSNISIFGSPLD